VTSEYLYVIGYYFDVEKGMLTTEDHVGTIEHRPRMVRGGGVLEVH
jgi:hypothetical protein